MAETRHSRTALLFTESPSLMRVATADLVSAGFEIRIVGRDSEAISVLEESVIDIAIIGTTGKAHSVFENYRTVRRSLGVGSNKSVPVILLVDPEDRERAIGILETGPDDFLILPLNPGILASRIDLIFSTDDPLSELGRIRYAGLTIDMRRHTVFCCGNEVRLSPIQFSILVLLFLESGRVISRREILNTIHDNTHRVNERSVDGHIRKLRDSLGTCGDLIQTIRSIGYRIRPTHISATDEES